jgi:type IV pilus assembly protein PilY1
VIWVVGALAACSPPLQADDTELYIANGLSTGQGRPQVLIIFDNSGSMRTEEAVAAQPFDPSVDYTGYVGNRLFYVRGSVDSDEYPDPQSGSEQRYLFAQNNACASSNAPHPADASFSVLEYEGRFTSNFRYFRDTGGWRARTWRPLVGGGSGYNRMRASVFDCAADLDAADPTNAPSASDSNFRGTGFPQNGDADEPFDGVTPGVSQADREAAAAVSGDATRFGQGDAATIFTENYLTYLRDFQEPIQRQRIAIARDTITSLINTTPGVDFGLMVFNYNYNSGSSIGSDDGGRIVSGVRQMTDPNRAVLADTVSRLNAETWTPLCESLFEAYRYYSGGAVLGGNKGGSQTPAADASITIGSRYVSPMQGCQPQSYVILITDGEPTRDNSYNSLIQAELGLSGSDSFDGSYLAGVAGWLRDNDVNDALQGSQRVVTYTIGFSQGAADAAALLEETALRGGGQYYAAEDALALQGSLQQIFSEILAVNSSFTSPSIAANSFDRTQTLDAIYYAMFLPSDRPRWAGNLKKLRIASDGRVVDQRGSLAINAEGSIADGACSIWTPSAICSQASSGGDGNDVLIGGAMEHVINRGSRRVLTNPAGATGELVEMDVDSLAAAVGGEAALLSAIGISDAEELGDYVDWLLGQDVDDDDGNGNRSETRLDVIGDPLHSKPLALSFGDTKGVRVLMGTNHGYLHMFQDNGTNIDESWSYYLPEMLPTLRELRANAQTGGHTVYGVDGAATAYVFDEDADGNIEPGTDNVWVFFGLRRGGRAYYALDISDPDSPELMWSVNSQSPGMSELGQTWSEPVITRIPERDSPVMIVGGGYDVNKDGPGVGTADATGRAIFLLDAETGELIHRFSAESGGGATVTSWPVTDSIAAKVTVLDSDGDGVTDRLYAPDTGGSIWRVDMPTGDPGDWSSTHFAELGGATDADDRRFFGEVTVAQTTFSLVETVLVDQDGEEVSVTTASETPYDAVLIGSGDRTQPNGEGTQNYLFALQDRSIKTQTFDESDNPAPAPIRVGDLYSVAGDPFSIAADGDALLTAKLELGERRGWYVPLSAKEKALSAPTLIAGQVYFTTFVPGNLEQAEACVTAGEGFLYAFSLQEGRRLTWMSVGARLPGHTADYWCPPPDEDDEGREWDPSLYLVGVGVGDDNTGTIATQRTLTPQRIYYQYGD